MEAFRQEIIETQKARSDLLKWKLIISAALGAVGLGINISLDSNVSNDDSPVDLAFCLIPFVCAYVDLLCYHLNLRMFVISKFFNHFQGNVNEIQKNGGLINWQDLYLLQKYEEICGKVRFAFELESWALKWSSIFLSVGVILPIYYAKSRTAAIWFLISGVLGIVIAIINEKVYENKAFELGNTKLDEIRLQGATIKPQIELNLLEWIKRFNSLLSIFFFVVGVCLLIKYIDISQVDEQWSRNPAAVSLLIPSGIGYIITATFIEHSYRKTIDLEKEKIKHFSVETKNLQSLNRLWKEWSYCLVFTVFIPINSLYLWTKAFGQLSNNESIKGIDFFKSIGIDVIGSVLFFLGIVLPGGLILFATLAIKHFWRIPSMLIINNKKLLHWLKSSYTSEDIRKISDFLENQGTFKFPHLNNGLFSAAILAEEREYTGYSSVWIRDNIYVAFSYYYRGQIEVAKNNVKTLMDYFKKYKHKQRFEKIIGLLVNPEEIMKRPHIRFEGSTLEEIDQEWNHAQNDALGYFLWFYCKLAREGHIVPEPEDQEILALFPHYFNSISYWQDEDSGHWEEDRKIEASSIGVVIAGLKELRELILHTSIAAHCEYKKKPITSEFLDELIDRGRKSLNNLLPSECIQPQAKQRRYDAALLFLIYPLKIVEGKMVDQILNDVIENLQGNYGIRRYLGDSFWCRDYKDIPEEIRTTISSEREQWFKENNRELKIGEEAQWCIFDPIVSAIFGLKFQQTHQKEDLEKQIHYLNRSLGQLTGKDCQFVEFKCPELYYLQHGQYVPNDATPLLWTQANLRIALKMMEQSLS